MQPYITKMSGCIQRARGYGQNGFELVVSVSFDAKQFNAIKKKSDPLSAGMAQIKNVVFDATGVRGCPGYSAISMSQRFPRSKRGVVTLQLSFDISRETAVSLGADVKQFCLYHSVDLQGTLESTRDDSHLFAKTAIASVMGH